MKLRSLIPRIPVKWNDPLIFGNNVFETSLYGLFFFSILAVYKLLITVRRDLGACYHHEQFTVYNNYINISLELNFNECGCMNR